MIKLKPFRQSEGMCGPASLKIILDAYGKEYSEKELAEICHTTPDVGTNHEDLVSCVERLGHTPAVKSDATVQELRDYVKRDVPVVVGWWDVDDDHYAVVYDVDETHVHMMDPELDEGERQMPIEEFEKVWYDFDSQLNIKVNRWMMAVPKA